MYVRAPVLPILSSMMFLLSGPVLATASDLQDPGVVSGAPSNDTKPNIVLVLMDNFGYGEIGVYGGGEIRGAG